MPNYIHSFVTHRALLSSNFGGLPAAFGPEEDGGSLALPSDSDKEITLFFPIN